MAPTAAEPTAGQRRAIRALATFLAFGGGLVEATAVWGLLDVTAGSSLPWCAALLGSAVVGAVLLGMSGLVRAAVNYQQGPGDTGESGPCQRCGGRH